jgi:hypothetical protein
MLFLPILACFGKGGDKDKFSGAYYGVLESNAMGFVISVEAKVIIGTVYLEKSEKLSFLGILNSKNLIEPTIFLESQSLELQLKFGNGELVINQVNSNEKSPYFFKKVSNNLAYNFSKEFGNNVLLDQELIGTWKMIASFKNGIEYPSKEAKGNYKSTYLKDGRYLGDIRTEIEKRKLGLDGINVSFKWHTVGNSLIIEPSGNPALSGFSHQTDYEIRKDTLIERIREFKYVYIKDNP